MPILLSLLRGINVSGQKKVPMSELKLLYENLGFKNIKTYIQSGNVVFTHDSDDFPGIALKIEQKIIERFDFKVPVIIRTLAETEAVVENNPFIQQNLNDNKLHVTFLAENPKQEYIDNLDVSTGEADRFIVSGKEIYLYCPNGYGRTKRTNTFFENKLKKTATTRNWKTVLELLRIMKSYPAHKNKKSVNFTRIIRFLNIFE